MKKSILFIAKLLPKNNTLQGLIIPLIIILPVLGILQLTNPGHFYLQLRISILIYALTTIWWFIDENYGRKQHKKALFRSTLMQLKGLGFEIENINEYWGYKGYYKNYYFKIYYDWMANLPDRNALREICIMIYFSPPKTENDCINIPLLEKLNLKYENGFLSTKQYVVNFKMACLKIHTPYRLFTSFDKIKKRIETAIEIVSNENLAPIQETEVCNLINHDPANYGPGITTFWEAKGI